ncbi:unnamed protein product [Prunus armeniaca]
MEGTIGTLCYGSKIALLIMEGGRDLAERWEEEQSKILSGICVPQFKYSIAQGSSLDYHYFLEEVMPGGGHYSSRLMFAIMAMNTSRGLLVTHRGHHILVSKGRSMTRMNLVF